MSISEVTMQYYWTSHSQMSKKIESDVSCLDALGGPSGNCSSIHKDLALCAVDRADKYL